MVSSANKCIEGVPGFGFIIARKSALEAAKGVSQSLSLDVHAQWAHMEKTGQWRYTPPTHVVAAFVEALRQHREEGGVAARLARYSANRDTLVSGMRELGFETLLKDRWLSPRSSRIAGSAPGATTHDRPPALPRVTRDGALASLADGAAPVDERLRLGRAALSECLKWAPVCACPLLWIALLLSSCGPHHPRPKVTRLLGTAPLTPSRRLTGRWRALDRPSKLQ